MKKAVSVKFQLPGVHRWDNAPLAVRYLRSEHRHLFYFECWAEVKEDDREIEFLQLQSEIINRISDAFWCVDLSLCDFERMSCEHIAQWVLKEFPVLIRVSVFEDNENGAVIVR